MEAKTKIWLENLRDERDGAALYEGLARLETAPERARSFGELADGEKRHAAVWSRKLESAGLTLPPDAPSPRVRMLLWLAKRFGTARVLPLIMQTEASDAAKYTRQGGEASDLAKDEEAHREVLVTLSGEAPLVSHRIASRERWHMTSRGGSIRAAIFGMNDGLVSNVSLVLGVAGAGADQRALIVTGFAGLLAGACSMAAGEYTSVASQRDLLQRQIDLERRELEDAPEEEAKELSQIFEQKGLSPEHAASTAKEILKNPDHALDTLVREELGLDPSDLGSPFGAASYSFLTFSAGAALPVLPFFVASGATALWLSAGSAGVVLAAVGGFLGFLSGTNPLESALRMLGLATAAAGITYGVGRLFGTTLG